MEFEPPEDPSLLKLDNSTATFTRPGAAAADAAATSVQMSGPGSVGGGASEGGGSRGSVVSGRSQRSRRSSGRAPSARSGSAYGGESQRPRTAPDQHHGTGGWGGTPFQLPTDRLMDVVVLRRRMEANGGVRVQASAGTFNGGNSGISPQEGSGMLDLMRETPLVQLGLRDDGTSMPRQTSVPGPGSDVLALKNKLGQSRQMLQEARRRIKMLEDARRNDAERAEMAIAMQVDQARAEAAVEIRKLKERAKMHEETGKANSFYMPQGNTVPSFNASPVGPPSAASSPARGDADTIEHNGSQQADNRMAERNLALSVELQQMKLKHKREKLDLVKKLEAAYLDARGLKQARNDMKGQVDALTTQLAKCKSDVLTWKFAASARDKAKRDKERWKDIKDQQKAPPVVVMDKWEVERDGLGKVIQPPTNVALEKELNALKKRVRDEAAMRDELKAIKQERNQLKQRLTMAEREAKQYGADARRLQAKQSKKGVGSMGSATGSKKAKQKQAKEQSRAESPLGSDEETRAVQEATIQGLTVELEKAIVDQEELREQLERTQLERVRAVAQRDEAIQALELAQTENEELAAQLEKLGGVGHLQLPLNPAEMPELEQDAAAAAAAVAESLISVPQVDVNAVDAAATKIQAAERGRVARANSPVKSPVAATGPESAPEEQFVSTDSAAEEAAATKIQAVHRGKVVRQQAAQSSGEGGAGGVGDTAHNVMETEAAGTAAPESG